ncbi:hypothetical protein [Tsukamurella hominis]
MTAPTGHPVRGKEAFVVHRDGDAALLVAQRVARARYVRALRRPGS